MENINKKDMADSCRMAALTVLFHGDWAETNRDSYGIEDLIAMNALYRPGPMDLIPNYIARKHGTEDVEYDHPSLVPVLEKTYGIPVYQEQVMQMAQVFAGFTLGGADMLRRAMGKKVQSEMDAQRDAFVSGAMDTHNVSKSLATHVFDQIDKFASYGFNRCVSGSTKLHRPWVSPGCLHPTIEQMYRIRHDRDYAKSIGSGQLHDKYRRVGYGKAYSLNEAGRLAYNRIVDIRYEGKDEVFEVTTETGRTIRCNARHSFPTTTGKKRLSELAVGDELFVILESKTGTWEKKGGMYGGPTNLPKKGQQGFQTVGDTPFKRWKAIKAHKRKNAVTCDGCGDPLAGRRVEVHHRDGDYLNATEANAEALCVGCHKKEHYALGRTRAGQKGLPSGTEAIVSVEPVGIEDVYDVEMEAPYHTFVTDTGIVTCNSHAAAYAILAYQEAWFSTHYPVEYMAAKLQFEADDNAKKRQYLAVARRMGVEVRPPSINSSGVGFEARVDSSGTGRVFYGLGSVKHVGEAAMDQVFAERSQGTFADMESFVVRVLCAERTKVNSRTVESLIKVGAFDEFGERAQMLHELPAWTKWAQKMRDFAKGTRKSEPEMPAFGDPGPPAPLESRLAWERELMGQYVSGHPMDGYEAATPMIERATGCSNGGPKSQEKTEEEEMLEAAGDEFVPDERMRSDTFSTGYDSEMYPVFGVISARQDKTTKTGKPYAVVTVQTADERETELFAWSEALNRFGSYLHEGERVLVIAELNPSFKDSVQSVVLATEVLAEWTSVCVVRPREGAFSEARALVERFSATGGSCQVVFEQGGVLVGGPDVQLTARRVRQLERLGAVELR